MDRNDYYKMNVYEGDTLKLDIKKEWGVDKFDVVLGNPPYNTEFVGTRSSPLYHKFIEKFVSVTQYLTFIIPSRWFSGGKGLDKFRKNMLSKTDIVFINHITDASSIFGNDVDIKGGVNYFLIDNMYDGMCNFNGRKIKLKTYDILVQSPDYCKIIDKMMSSEHILTDIFCSQSFYKIETNDKRLYEVAKKNSMLCYVSQQKGFKKYIDKKHIKRENSWKVITARAAHKGQSGFGNMFVGKPTEVHTASYISFNLDTKKEAKSLLSYLQTRLPNFMLSLRKISQDISGNSCKWIPLPPLDREWDDNKVYKYFKLTPKEIEIVKNAEIVGYK